MSWKTRNALAIAAFVASAASAQEAREIVRRAIEVDRRNSEALRNYTFLQRNQVREYNGNGTLKKTDDRTWDVTILEGSPYRRLVARNGQPLSAEESAAEQRRLQQGAELRRKETPAERERRIQDWRRKQEKQREPLSEFPDAFSFRIAGEEVFHNVPVWVLEALPKPGYKPKISSASFFPKVKARLWIEKSGYAWLKIEMETLDTISFGAIVLRLAKGSHLTIEQEHVNGEAWLPRQVLLEASARILLFKSMRAQYEFTFSDYRKFQVESRVIGTSSQ
jgi:hypothetical protein